MNVLRSCFDLLKIVTKNDSSLLSLIVYVVSEDINKILTCIENERRRGTLFIKLR